MKLGTITAALAVALLITLQPALADRGKDESGNYSRGKQEQQKNAKGNKGGKQSHDHSHSHGNGRQAARFERNGPPPWAPAHGYRRNQGDGTLAVSDRYDPEFEARVQADNARVSADIGISSGTCNRDTIGTVLGAVAGGVIGNRVSSEENRTVGTVAGVVVGGIVGHTIGRSMDKRDVQCTGQALERAADNRTVAWRNPDNGREYQVTPTQTYSENGLYCREYVTRAVAGSQREESRENACRHPDGSWRMVSR